LFIVLVLFTDYSTHVWSEGQFGERGFGEFFVFYRDLGYSYGGEGLGRLEGEQGREDWMEEG
jgi:hypothetical protein